MYIHVHAVTGARKEEVVEEKPSYFRISVKEKAEKNMANQRIITLVSEHFGTKQVRIVSGHHHQRKLLSVGAD